MHEPTSQQVMVDHAARTRRVLAGCVVAVVLAAAGVLLAPLLVRGVKTPNLQPAELPKQTQATLAQRDLNAQVFDAPLWTVALPPPPPPTPLPPPPPPPLTIQLVAIEGVEGHYRAVVYDTATDALRSLRAGDKASERTVVEIRRSELVLELAGVTQLLSLDTGEANEGDGKRQPQPVRRSSRGDGGSGP